MHCHRKAQICHRDQGIDALYMLYHPYILSHDHILLFLLLIMVMKNLDAVEVNLEIK